MVPFVYPLSSISFIDTLPADKHALHDIRFRFKVDNIWTVISTNHPELKPNEVSKDISLDPLLTHDLTIKTTIHHTDTISVIVACSLIPVAADLKGLVRLSNALTRVEERVLRYIECAPPSPSLSPIPDHESWIVTMWHFGHDSPNEYTGDEFEVAWEDGQNALFRIYTKDLNGVTRIRKERQEYPNKRFDEAIDEKLPTIIKILSFKSIVTVFFFLFILGHFHYHLEFTVFLTAEPQRERPRDCILYYFVICLYFFTVIADKNLV
jgi:hypothetical protein